MILEQLRIGLERNVEGRSLAWALDLPGAFAYGSDDAEALSNIPTAVEAYQAWIGWHCQESWLKTTPIKMQVLESLDSFTNSQGITISALFENDRTPLAAIEIDQALQMHAWQRQDLLAGVAALILSQNPGLSYAALRQMILNAVDKMEAWEGQVMTGGRLNAARAIGGRGTPVAYFSFNDGGSPNLDNGETAEDFTVAQDWNNNWFHAGRFVNDAAFSRAHTRTAGRPRTRKCFTPVRRSYWLIVASTPARKR